MNGNAGTLMRMIAPAALASTNVYTQANSHPERARLPRAHLARSQRHDPARARSRHQPGHRIRRDRGHRDADQQEEAHRLHRRHRRGRVPRHERQREECERHEREPERDEGRGVGDAASSSDATDTSPMSIPQNAGSSTIVAIVIAFHFCCGDSGAMPAERDRTAHPPAHPFTDPAVRPRTK